MAEGDKPKSGNSPADKREDRRKELRDKIQRQIDQAKEDQRRELLRRRIEVAKRGLKDFNARKYQDAVTSFVTYIRILEDWKKVAPGSLHPDKFDLKKDVAELMLINSVYWHLMKLFDKNKGPEFTNYTQKFIIFTKGMPFQPLSAETLRKYIRNKGIVHKSEMKSAYTVITGSRCFVATSLVDVVEPRTIPALREFRDEVLHRSRPGRAFVGWYYRLGPGMARGMDRSPEWLRAACARGLDYLASRLR